MQYVDKETFIRVLMDVWNNCSLMNGMSSEQVLKSLSHRKVLCGANAVKATKSESIRFLEVKVRQHAYMKVHYGDHESDPDHDLALSE